MKDWFFVGWPFALIVGLATYYDGWAFFISTMIIVGGLVAVASIFHGIDLLSKGK